MTMDEGTVLFLDFEASSLSPSSYPIQVAYSLPDGQVECWLIKPAAAWGDWDEYAEHEIHQISRSMLNEHGMSPVWVLNRMNSVLQGQTLYCDGGSLDQRWLTCLAEAAKCSLAFQLQDVRELFPWELWMPRDSGGNLYEDLSAEAWRDTPGRRHQADVDVRYLMNLRARVEKLYGQ